jgi:hypothetical protein
LLERVREISAEWMREYNDERPHDTLDGMPRPCFGLTKPDVSPDNDGKLKLEYHDGFGGPL